ACSQIHAHVQRTVSNETEAALCIFELTGRDAQVKERAADLTHAELLEDTIRMPEISLPHDDAPAKMPETLTCVPDGIGVLIQGQDVCASLQERFGVAAAAACRVQYEHAFFRLEQFKHFSLQHWQVIDEVLYWLCAFFGCHRIGSEPRMWRVPDWIDGVLTQHTCYNPISFATCW